MTRLGPLFVSIGLITPVWGCGGDAGRDDGLFGPGGGPGGGDGSTGGGGDGGDGNDGGGDGGDDGGSGDGGDDGAGDDGDDDGGARFDVAGGEGDGGGNGDGTEVCRKVDLLLAVDNSGSMTEEMAALQGAVFNSFPQQLLAVGNGLDDFHLGVIDGCNQPPNLHNWGESGDCNFSTGANYMVSTSPTFDQEYACVTRVSDRGKQGILAECDDDDFPNAQGDPDEQPANSAADAVSEPVVNAVNAGFLRDDAVLFIVAITDEDEQPYPTQSAQQIADKIIDAKGTIKNVVFLGIGGVDDGGGGGGGASCPPLCLGGLACDGPYGSAGEATFLQDITAVFEAQGRGLYWNLCDGNLEQAFAEAIKLVDGACEDWVPPG